MNIFLSDACFNDELACKSGQCVQKKEFCDKDTTDDYYDYDYDYGCDYDYNDEGDHTCQVKIPIGQCDDGSDENEEICRKFYKRDLQLWSKL